MENGTSKANQTMIGDRYGLLTVIDGPIKDGRIWWLCRCACGTEKQVRQDHMRSQRVISCGCHQKRRTSEVSKIHGMKNTRIYTCWRNMKTRCYNPNFIGFDRYGGRGIRVCEEWQEFLPFYEWAMANGYKDDLSIDRIDNDGNYCPQNCRWATTKGQALNRSSNCLIEYKGVRRHISEWDKMIGSKKSGRVRARLNAGWSIEEAVTKQI